MNKNLSVINQNNKLMLKKSKSLMSITNNILSNDDWVQRLWDWADENSIPELTWIDKEEHKNGGYWYGLPKNKIELSTFKILNLIGYELKEVSKDISHLINLHKLYLGKNNLHIIPNEIGNLTNLRRLELGGNKLTKLPQKISNLCNLIELSIWGNHLEELLPEVDGLRSLKVLWLHKNNLQEIPIQIGSLSKLNELALSKNKLKELPIEIGNLTNLEKLFLNENNLYILPHEITNLVCLKFFDIEDNPNLILTIEQKTWIHELIENECEVTMDDDLMERTFQTDYEIAKGR